MKRFLLVVVCALTLLSAVPAAHILSETIIPHENVVGVYQETDTDHYYMVFYYGYKKTKKMASISKSEVKKYYTAKELGVDFQIIWQQLKSKQRVIIRC